MLVKRRAISRQCNSSEGEKKTKTKTEEDLDAVVDLALINDA